MKKDVIAIATYKYFSGLEGNQHIASEFALKKLNEIIHNFKVKSILELGLGIGSISYSVLEFSSKINNPVKYIGTESNDFCLSVLPNYLKLHFNKIRIFEKLDDVPATQKFDLVIIDGKEENLIKLKNLMSEKGIIVIEGDRLPQLEMIKEIFTKSLYTRVVSNYRSPNYGPFPSNDWCGGIQLVFINPDWQQKMSFIKYKIYTAINYRLRTVN